MEKATGVKVSEDDETTQTRQKVTNKKVIRKVKKSKAEPEKDLEESPQEEQPKKELSLPPMVPKLPEDKTTEKVSMLLPWIVVRFLWPG